MINSRAEELTSDFYLWERRGRGWHVFDTPVELEPVFVPFFYHSPVQRTHIDDGRRPNLLNRVIELFTGNNDNQNTQREEPEYNAYIDDENSPLRVLSISLPKEHKVSTEESEQLLLMLADCKRPVSFEIIATSSSITIQFVCRDEDSIYIQNQLKAYFFDIIVSDTTETLLDIIKENGFASIIELGLSDEFMRPLNMVKNLDLDPFKGIFASLENLESNEQVVLQILFKGTVNPWSESIIRSVVDNNGEDFFMDAPEMLPLAKEKIDSPLFAVIMRVVGQSHSVNKANQLSNSLYLSLARFYNSPYNSLIPILNDSYTFEERAQDVYFRSSHRLGMLLNSRELLTLVHVPSASVTSLKFERDTKKTKLAPQITQGHDLILGLNTHQKNEKVVSISPSQRLRHTHIIGATGTGKSTLLLNLITQDIDQGNSIAVLDPHGDLIESILTHIPEDRLEDLIIIDPSDSEFPIGFNILSAHTEIEKDILSSDLVGSFKRLSTSWGDQMNSVLANAILAFVESTKGGTLIELRRFLLEKSFRDEFLQTVTDPNIIYYWQREYPLLKSSSIGSILTRLDTFLRPKVIRNMVAQKKGLDFEQILDSNKILLVKLSQGLIGTENSYLLGSLIVSKIHQAAMARQAKQKSQRHNFYLYIDEFQNFITPSVVSILSGARKYNLGLILAHQEMQQLMKHDSELAASIISNAGTRVCFRVGDVDAKRFESGFSYFESKDLQNLDTGEAIVRIDRADYDFNMQTFPLENVEIEVAESRSNAAIEFSRSTYGTPREEVESILLEQIQNLPESKPIKEKVTKTILPKLEEEIPITQSPITSTIPKEVSPEISDPIKAEFVKKKAETQHRFLQNLVKKMAESRGYRASIEEPTPDGNGRVDVSLERKGKRIACEISVTTPDEWEVHNIEKCIAAGYDLVVEISSEPKVVESMKKKVENYFNIGDATKVMVATPDVFFLFLDSEVAKDSATESRHKGYRVKVEYEPATEKEILKKHESISRAIFDSGKLKK